MLQQSALILFVLLGVVVLSEWLAKKKFFKLIGSVILVILGGAILSNTGVLPAGTTSTPAYDLVLTYLAPLAIFFLLLEVNLADLKKAGAPMLLMFALGAVATVSGVLTGWSLWHPAEHGIEPAAVVAGMYTGTYIGGSINLNAIALQYNMAQQGTMFAMVNAVDNLVGTPWILATILLPRLLWRFFPGKKNAAKQLAVTEALPTPTAPSSLTHFATLLALGLGTLGFSNWLSTQFPQLPSIITLTTIALVLAHIPVLKKLRGSHVLGMLFVLLFLAVVGTFCNVNAVMSAGSTALWLVLWVSTIILVHGIIIFGIGGLCKIDWDIIAVASNANIGGSASAPIAAAALGRADLQVPGILVGSLGNAVGTYIGFWVVGWLEQF